MTTIPEDVRRLAERFGADLACRTEIEAAIMADRAANGGLREALRPFAECAAQIDPDEDDEEWAKFRLLIKDYRAAAAAFAASPKPTDTAEKEVGDGDDEG